MITRLVTMVAFVVTCAAARGGCEELMVTFEDYCVPVVTKVSSIELAMLHDVGMVGLASTMTKVNVEVGSDVVVLGCGPVGLSAVQGARIQGAAQIISIGRARHFKRPPTARRSLPSSSLLHRFPGCAHVARRSGPGAAMNHERDPAR